MDVTGEHLLFSKAKLLRANLERFQPRIRDSDEKARKKLPEKNDPLEPDPENAT